MKQEDKELLLKDLCAGLPYKVIIKSVGENKIISLWDLKDIDNLPLPYLRPMSSMTEEEEKEICQFMKDYNLLSGPDRAGVFCGKIVDWLNAHHFDYRGLIEKGLAIEVPEGMYK